MVFLNHAMILVSYERPSHCAKIRIFNLIFSTYMVCLLAFQICSWRVLELVACFFRCPGSFTCLYTASCGFYFYYIKIMATLQRVIFGNSTSVFDFFSPKDRKYVLKM